MRDERDIKTPYGTELYGEQVSEKELEDKIIQDYPKLVEKPFKVNREKLSRKLLRWSTLGFFFKKEPEIALKDDLKQPLLFLIRDDGFTDIIEGVKPNAIFRITPKGTDIQKGIILSPKKLTTLNIEPYYKTWIAYENEMTPYPLDIYHDSSELVSIVRTIQTSRNNALKDEAKVITAKMWFWLAILGVIGVILYFGMQNGWFNSLLGK